VKPELPAAFGKAEECWVNFQKGPSLSMPLYGGQNCLLLLLFV
jgi:hypothetical protein